MNKLQIVNQNGVLLAESRQVAEMIGKQHKHLLRDIEGYIKVLIESNFGLNEFFIESSYVDSIGRTLKCYLITRKGCDMVANKMIGEKGILFTASYVTRFEEMEKQLAKTSLSNNESTKLEIQKQRAEAMLKNAQTKQAKLLIDAAHHFRDRLPDVTVESLIAAGTKTLTGQDLIPQRNVGQKFYTCEEIAKKIGMLSKNGKPHNQAVAALIKHIGFSDDEVTTVVESTGPWQGTTDKYAESVLRRVEQKVRELGYPSALNLGKVFNVYWAHQSA